MSLLKSRIFNFPNLLSAGFFVAALVQVWNHIMWRDEIRTWQVAREATGLISLWELMRYEGVPVLWYWIVFVLTRVSDNPFLMQFVHVLIATGVIYVVARWAPFSRVNRVLFSVGYFPFFEYAAITRNYSLVFLLVVIACVLISQERVRLIALAIVLFLMSQVSIWGAGFAGLMLIAVLLKGWKGPAENRPSLSSIFAAGGIVGLGFILCIIEVLPGPGPSFTDSWAAYTPAQRVLLSLGAIYRAWIPLPLPGPHFWNTNILDLRPELQAGPVLQAVLAIVLFIVVAATFVRRPLAIIWYLAAIGALVGFTFLKFKGFARHEGMIFVVLIGAMWLSTTGPKLEIRSKALDWLERWRGAVLSGLLGIGAAAGIGCAAAGLVMPFSATHAVADFIKAEKFDQQAVLVAYTDYCAAPISQWLDQPFYSIAMHQDVWYNTQNDAERDNFGGVLRVERLLAMLHQLIQQRHKPVLLMLNSGMGLSLPDPLIGVQSGPDQPVLYMHVVEIARPEFERGIVKDEGHKLYLVHVADLTK